MTATSKAELSSSAIGSSTEVPPAPTHSIVCHPSPSVIVLHRCRCHRLLRRHGLLAAGNGLRGSRLGLRRRRERRAVNLVDGDAGDGVGGLLAHVTLVDGGLLGAAHRFLGFGDIALGGARGRLIGPVAVVSGQIADLRGLLGDDLLGVGDVVVDEVLVGDVDERGEVDDGGGDESQAPVWGDLDEEVGEEGGEEGLRRSQSALKSAGGGRDRQRWWHRRSRRR